MLVFSSYSVLKEKLSDFCYLYFKGTVARDFSPLFFSRIDPPRNLIHNLKLSKFLFHSPWYSTFMVLPCCRPQRGTRFLSIGNSTEFGYVLRATAYDLIQQYGPQRRIQFCAKGHSVKPAISLIHTRFHVHLCALARVSTWMWRCIHDMYLCVWGFVPICMWSCIHVHVFM
jgi:hypothetical protein